LEAVTAVVSAISPATVSVARLELQAAGCATVVCAVVARLGTAVSVEEVEPKLGKVSTVAAKGTAVASAVVMEGTDVVSEIDDVGAVSAVVAEGAALISAVGDAATLPCFA
jgi:hypothetical protein